MHISIDYIHYLSTTKYHNDNIKCPTTLTKTIYQLPRNCYSLRSTRYQASRRKKDRERKKTKHKKKKNETKQTYMRSGSRPSPEGTRLLFAGGTVSPMMCTADGQQKDSGRQKRPDGRQAKMRGETNAKKTIDRHEAVGFRWISICVVNSKWCGVPGYVCDIAWHIVICRDIMPRIMRYHKNLGTDMEVSYLVEIFIDTEAYFLPARCTKLGAPSEWKKKQLFGGRTSEAVIFIGKCT